MNNIQSRWFLGLGGTLLVALAGCDVSVGKCDRDDAGECVNLFPDDDEDGGTGKSDAGRDRSVADAGVDGAAADAGDVDASGADAGGADAGDIGPAITVDEFCIAQLATAVSWRDQLEDFCVAKDLDWRNSFLSLSLAYTDASEDKCVNERKASIASGSIVFDGTHAQRCASIFADQFTAPPASFPAAGLDIAMYEATIGHGAQTLVQIPQCRAAFKGTLARDKVCADSLECVDGLRCLVATGNTRTCQPAVTPPGICARTSDCADGFTCAGPDGGAKSCIPSNDLRLDGGGCFLSAECVSGSVCTDAGKCAPAVANLICEP